MAFIFDGASKTIYVPNGMVTFDALDLYSEWKRWAILLGNAMFLPAMRSIGGDQLTAVKYIAGYIEVINDWKIKPYDGDYTLTVVGNLFATGGVSPFVSADNGTVIISSETTGNALALNVGGGNTASGYSDVIYVDTSIVDYTGITYPIGTIKKPAASLEDAILICVEENIKEIITLNSLTISEPVVGYTVRGDARHLLDLNDVDVSKTTFEGLTVTGTHNGDDSVFSNCDILHPEDIAGTIKFSVFKSTDPISFRSNTTVFILDCISAVSGLLEPKFSLINGNVSLSIRNMTGPVSFIQSSMASNVVSCDFISGKVAIGPTNSEGIFVIRGNVDMPLSGTNPNIILNVNGVLNTLFVADATWKKVLA